MAVAGLCLSLGRIVGFVPLVCAGPGAGPNGFELTFHVAGLVVLNVSPVWVSCGWSVRPLPALCCVVLRWRPYRVECTGSLPTSEVKRRRARLVLGWGTAREDLRVLPAFEVWGCDQAMFVSWVCFGVWVPSCALATGMAYVEALLSLVGRCGSGASVWRVGLRCCQLWFGQRRNLDPVQQLLEFVYWRVVSASGSAVAQWLACWAHNPKVRGSKPRCAISWLSLWCVPLRYYGWLGCSFIRVFGCVRCVVVCSAAWCEMRQERVEPPT